MEDILPTYLIMTIQCRRVVRSANESTTQDIMLFTQFFYA